MQLGLTPPNPNGFETFKAQLASMAMIDGVTYTNSIPGHPGWMGQVAYPEGKTGDDAVSVEYMAVDEKYLDVLGLELIAGRGFDLQRENGFTGRFNLKRRSRISIWMVIASRCQSVKRLHRLQIHLPVK
ncbi:MAG: hypothetical protein U5K54_05235 [Cytophagales bacterium]|nr:hypothetical protein [Cytophagales bacterium]